MTGTKNKGETIIESNNVSNTNITKIVGNQYVILAAEGCQLFNIGRTNPNFFTCIQMPWEEM